MLRFVSVEAKLRISNRFGAVYSYKRGDTSIFDRERIPNIKRLLILHLCSNFPVGNQAVVGVRNRGECESHQKNMQRNIFLTIFSHNVKASRLAILIKFQPTSIGYKVPFRVKIFLPFGL